MDRIDSCLFSPISLPCRRGIALATSTEEAACGASSCAESGLPATE
jgi:hypothetical protein